MYDCSLFMWWPVGTLNISSLHYAQHFKKILHVSVWQWRQQKLTDLKPLWNIFAWKTAWKRHAHPCAQWFGCWITKIPEQRRKKLAHQKISCSRHLLPWCFKHTVMSHIIAPHGTHIIAKNNSLIFFEGEPFQCIQIHKVSK